MKRYHDNIEVLFEREESDSNEARLLAAFEMIFAGIDLPNPVRREEHSTKAGHI